MKQYWVLGDSGQPEGPYLDAVVLQGLVQGRWNSTTLVCEVGREDWIPLAGLQNIDFRGGEAAARLLQGGAAGFRTAAARVSRIERDEIDAWLLLPAKLSEQTLRFLKRVITESVLEWIAIAFGWVGIVAVPIGMLAAMLTIIVSAFRDDRISTFWLVVPFFVGACFLQFVAARFSREADVAVRQTPTEYSRGSVFDMLGLLLVALGISVLLFGIGQTYRALGFAPVTLSICVVGLLSIAMGGFFLHPASLGMTKLQSSTIGQDGIAIMAAFAKGGLKAVRVSFGIASTAGAALACYGAAVDLVKSDSMTGELWLAGGIALLVYGSLLPLLTYLVSMVVFIVIEFLDHVVGRDRRDTRTDSESEGAAATATPAAETITPLPVVAAAASDDPETLQPLPS